MRFGFYLPTRDQLATPEAIGALLGKGEACGFHSVMIADHVVFPVKIESPYPYTVSGAFPGTDGDALDQLALMSFAAATTKRLRLVTSVMILPHRNPVLTAKMLATVDVLSKGRVTVGAGVGWLREEFEALGADFDRRGAVSNEYIEIFKKCWTQDPVEHQGRFYSFKALHCLPHPVQKPHPPIWIGGHSKPALRRVARYGDGWHPVGATAASPLPPDEMRTLLDELKRLTEAEGRDFSKLAISYKAPLYDGGKPAAGTNRRILTGSPGQIVEDVHTLAGLGISELVFDYRHGSLNESLDRMEQFASEVMPQARG